jgi:hypothetical protein
MSPSANRAEFGAKAPVRSLLEYALLEDPIGHLSDRLGSRTAIRPAEVNVRSGLQIARSGRFGSGAAVAAEVALPTFRLDSGPSRKALAYIADPLHAVASPSLRPLTRDRLVRTHVENAVMDWGRTGTSEAVKEHVIRRACVGRP